MSAFSRLAIGAAFAALFAAAACSVSKVKSAPPPPADHIIFSHKAHVEGDVECIVCHDQVYDATTLDGNFLPKEAVCMDCHEEEKESGNCAFCHTHVKQARGFPTEESHLIMSHVTHIERVEEDCSRCHTQLSEPGPPQNLTPTMDSCLSCHEHEEEFADASCMGCHKDLYDLKPGTRFTHQGDFIRSHGLIAADAMQQCATCHGQAFCADCHSGTVVAPIEIRFAERTERPFVHRNDFVGHHQIDATAEPSRCLQCHAPQFCESCHTLQNLTPQATNPLNPHPPNWVFPPGSPNGHAVAARQEITNCAACHDQGAQSNCVNCHKVGGIGGNPHPPSWLSHNSASEIKKQAMCLYCH